MQLHAPRSSFFMNFVLGTKKMVWAYGPYGQRLFGNEGTLYDVMKKFYIMGSVSSFFFLYELRPGHQKNGLGIWALWATPLRF